ncbi:MAG: DUF1289 domain-containing protein [Pseudomonadota bacterium]
MSVPLNEPLSPCVRICTLDDSNICIGCGRTLDEITRWSRLDGDERRQIMDRIAADGVAPRLSGSA